MSEHSNPLTQALLESIRVARQRSEEAAVYREMCLVSMAMYWDQTRELKTARATVHHQREQIRALMASSPPLRVTADTEVRVLARHSTTAPHSRQRDHQQI